MLICSRLTHSQTYALFPSPGKRKLVKGSLVCYNSWVMNIALRPSGGRGEYELAGRQGGLLVHDLFGLAMFIEILPGVDINAYSHCVLKDGKPRIRLTQQQTRNAHPSSLIAAAMVLPKPRRERHETHGKNLLRGSNL
jgi:hypothetical protein